MKIKIVLHAVVFVLLFLGGACAQSAPEGQGFVYTSVPGAVSSEAMPALRPINGIPARHMIDNVPLYVQARNECGPTSLSMVMNFLGIKEMAQALKSSLKWHAENGVAYQNMIHFPYQKYGLEVAFAGEGSYGKLLEELSQDHPVLVRQWANAEEKQLRITGHWRIAVGYDQKEGKIYLNDPMFAKSTCLDSREFLNLWDMSGHTNPTVNYMFLLRKADGRQKEQKGSSL